MDPRRPFIPATGLVSGVRATIPPNIPGTHYRNPPGGPQGAVAGGPPPAPVPAQQLVPWWEYPYESSQNFNAFVQGLTLAAGAGNTTGTDPAVSFTVPDGYYWVVRGVTIFVISPDNTFNATWFLRANGTIQGSPFNTFGRIANSVEVPFPLVQVGKGPSILDIRIVNNAASGPWTVGAAFTGWVTPVVSVQQVFGTPY